MVHNKFFQKNVQLKIALIYCSMNHLKGDVRLQYTIVKISRMRRTPQPEAKDDNIQISQLILVFGTVNIHKS